MLIEFVEVFKNYSTEMGFRAMHPDHIRTKDPLGHPVWGQSLVKWKEPKKKLKQNCFASTRIVFCSKRKSVSNPAIIGSKIDLTIMDENPMTK